MKMCFFYVTKKQRVIENKDIAKVIECMVKVGASAFVISQISPILYDLVGTPIVAHASTHATTTVETSAITEGANKLVAISEELVKSVQKIAEPVSYGFCTKGILEKMSGNENIGNKHMKDSLKGYVIIQVLPMIYDMIDIFQ